MYLLLSLTASMGVSGFVCGFLGDWCAFISLTLVSVSIPESGYCSLVLINPAQLSISLWWLSLLLLALSNWLKLKASPWQQRTANGDDPTQKLIWPWIQGYLPETGINRWATFCSADRNYTSFLTPAPEHKSKSLFTEMQQKEKHLYKGHQAI